MTKSFTAKQMHNAPGPVFRAADRDGSVQITHDHYKDRVFMLVTVDKEAFDHEWQGEYEETTTGGVSKKLLREFNDSYNQLLSDMSEAMAIAAPKIRTTDRDCGHIVITKSGVKED